MPASSSERTPLWHYYRFATVASLAVYGLTAVYAAATHDGGALLLVLMLAVLEISLSFDNAIVNSIYVQRLSPEWQVRFLRYGIVIAVVGMRLLFPIAVVSLSGPLDPVHVVETAFTDPRAYASSLAAGHLPLVAFGGIYLLQIFLNFFLGAEKEATWLVWLERPLEKAGRMTGGAAVIVPAASAVAVGVLAAVWSPRAVTVVVAGASSIALFQLVGYIGGKLEAGGEDDGSGSRSTAAQLRNLTGKAALFTFLYLELQDAMFSFDGVLGAFAFTSLMVLIMAGLGIGALYVRSMTIHLVETGALAKLRYLGNGAFWAIGVLPFSMWFGFPDYVTGGISLLLILAAVGHSGLANQREGTGFFSAMGKDVTPAQLGD
jgi:hypothetical protein